MPEEGSPPVDVLQRTRTAQDVAVVLLDRYLNVLASNALSHALTPGFAEGLNLAKFTFQDSAIHADDVRWSETTGEVAALLRESLATFDADGHFRSLVGELAATSRTFATMWADEGAPTRAASVTFPETPVGSLTLTYSEECVEPGSGWALMLFRPPDEETAVKLRDLSNFLGMDPFGGEPRLQVS